MMPDAGYAHEYDPDADFDHWYTVLAARRIAPLLPPGSRILELGSATGAMTTHIAGHGRHITCIERSAAYIARARARDLPGVVVHQAEIGGPIPDAGPFDAILATNLLHELPDGALTLRHVLPTLAPGGCLYVTLPNPASLHRLAAVATGLLAHPAQLSDRGRRLQTLRLQEPDEFVCAMAELGLIETRREGILVKPLPNATMSAVSGPLIEAWDALAHHIPGHAAMTWFVFARHAQD